MSEYYAVIRSTDHLAHYGVKGMKWGVRKKFVEHAKNRAQNRLLKRIDKNSNSLNGTWSSNYRDHSNGFFSAPNSNNKSNRYKLWLQMANEYDRSMNGHGQDGGPKAEKNWKRISKKYQRAYLEAVLKDSKIPVNRKNLETAHNFISKKDSEYSRYNSKFRY